MLPVIMAIMSMAKQKADAQNAQNAQLAQNLQNQQVNGQQQQPTLQLPHQNPQQNNMNRLQQVMSLMGR